MDIKFDCVNSLPLFFAMDDTELEGVTTGVTLVDAAVDVAILLMTEAESLGLLPSAKVSSRVHKLCDIHVTVVIVNLDFANWYSHLVYSLAHTSGLHPQTQVVLGFQQLCIYTIPYH